MDPKDEAALYAEIRDAADDEDTRIIAGIMADLAREKVVEIEERTWNG